MHSSYGARKMLKSSWKEKLTSKAVLNKMKTKMKFYSNILIRKLAFAGHVMRGSSGKLILTVLEGKTNEKKGKGRSRKKWINDLYMRDKDP